MFYRNPTNIQLGDIYESEPFSDEDLTPFFVVTFIGEKNVVVRPVKQIGNTWIYSGETAGVPLDRFGRLKGFKRGLFDRWTDWNKQRNPKHVKSKLFGNCEHACDPELCRLLAPYMRNPCARHTKSRQYRKLAPKKRGLKRKRSIFGDCSKACDPELCRLLKPYMRRLRYY